MTWLRSTGLLAAAALACPAQAQDSSADAAAETARAAARADRHAEAIAAFRAAIALAPERTGEWRRELADQLTWSRQFAEAIALYRAGVAADQGEAQRQARIGLARALSWAGQHDAAIAEYGRALAMQPQDRDVAIARAQVLGWASRLGAAEAAYAALLRANPDDADALRGRARMRSWRGDYRAAIADAQRLLALQPGDREGSVILAEARIWMGRGDLALPVLRAAAAQHPDHRHLAKLLDAQQQRLRPEVRADLRLFDQSDDLAISEASIDLRLPIDAGRGSVGLRYARAAYRPPQARRDGIRVDRPALHGGYRISDAVEVNGAVALDIIIEEGRGRRQAPLTFEGYATLRPVDAIRIDAGVSRWTFDSEVTLRAALIATQLGASIDVIPADGTTLSARISRTKYTDGNRRNWQQVELAHRLLDRPRLTAGYRLTRFAFRLPWQPGYYSPAGFTGHEVTLRGYGDLSLSWRWDLRLAGGIEREKGGSSRAIVNAGLSIAKRLSARLEAEAAYDYSSSRSFSPDGFRRSIARITLRARF